MVQQIMSTKVKGIFKGFRYISQIFDEKEEDEIQIGFPTDVKHVAHIGMDGPSANAPSWMNDFKGSSDVSSPKQEVAPPNSLEIPKDNNKNSKGSKLKDIPNSRHQSIDNTNLDSPKRSSDGTKPRRHRSSDPTSDTSTGTRPSRRNRNSNPGSDSTAADGTKPRRRKTKTASVDGSEKTEKSSRRSSKGDSMTDISLPDLDSVPESELELKHIEE
ncbi:CRIB domain-containing protein RIC7-like [Senna tora]|uniref:CRIB domain-containing protein RIC7-like n=1 Tax=Senna tora TaxID=362788 RepID=A0A835CCC7_9FABA|nr:CRIB domain-containing protein RIC7-like [Senna tora]